MDVATHTNFQSESKTPRNMGNSCYLTASDISSHKQENTTKISYVVFEYKLKATLIKSDFKKPVISEEEDYARW